MKPKGPTSNLIKLHIPKHQYLYKAVRGNEKKQKKFPP